MTNRENAGALATASYRMGELPDVHGACGSAWPAPRGRSEQSAAKVGLPGLRQCRIRQGRQDTTTAMSDLLRHYEAVGAVAAIDVRSPTIVIARGSEADWGLCFLAGSYRASR
jgi:hypothetical protein